MMQTRTAYRNSPESKSETSIPCHQPIQPRPLTPQNEHFAKAVHLGAVAQTLDDLIEMGLIETYVDEHRITRYRPTGGRIV
jgi:hypothetical protein